MKPGEAVQSEEVELIRFFLYFFFLFFLLLLFSRRLRLFFTGERRKFITISYFSLKIIVNIYIKLCNRPDEKKNLVFLERE